MQLSQTGVMWLRRGIRFNIRAAWFCIRCNLSICFVYILQLILNQVFFGTNTFIDKQFHLQQYKVQYPIKIIICFLMIEK